MHRNKMKSESQKHAEKKVNKTKKNDGIHENCAFCFAMFRMCSFYFSHFFFRVIVVIGFSCFFAFSAICTASVFFFICLFHVHFSPDNFHLFRLVFTFFSLCLRISCLLLFVRLFFFQCCSLCFWIYIFFLCIVCFVFSAFFETYFARA